MLGGSPRPAALEQTGLRWNPMRSFCIAGCGGGALYPMMAQSEVVGLLHLQYEPGGATGKGGDQESFHKSQETLASAVAGQIALALASLRLRETLREQSIRDPLTGLFNRRIMQESLNRELHRARRKNHPVTVALVDLDHFKRFNDTWGHDAGDLVLKTMAQIFRSHFRAEDANGEFSHFVA